MIYTFTLPNIVDALVEAKNAGLMREGLWTQTKQ